MADMETGVLTAVHVALMSWLTALLVRPGRIGLYLICAAWAGLDGAGVLSLHLPVRLGFGGAELRRVGETQPQSFHGEVDLISVAVHPADPARAVLIYCAPPSRLPALVLLDPGAWDFVLYDGTVALKSGSYERSRIPWRVR